MRKLNRHGQKKASRFKHTCLRRGFYFNFVSHILRYIKQEKLESFNFNIPLIKLLCVMNKEDKAFEILKNEPEIFENSNKVLFILMNKLAEEKRYDDVIRTFNEFSEKKENPNAGVGSLYLILSVLSRALLEKVGFSNKNKKKLK